MTASDGRYTGGAVWQFFGLTRSSYLVLPRRALCSMPLDWQTRFVALLEEARAALPDEVHGAEYTVQLRGNGGRFKRDPMGDYRNCAPIELNHPTEKRGK